MLYIGLAVDLPNRLGQHFGFVQCRPHCCKKNQIDEFFKANQRLGYSILVQSRLDQGVCDRWKKVHTETIEWITERFDFEDAEATKNALNIGISREIRTYEGALILAHELQNGSLPPWNRIKGASVPMLDSSVGTADFILRSLTCSHQSDDPLAAHVPLRELVATPMFQGYEELLHASRMYHLAGLPPEKAFDKNHDPLGYYQKMKKESYLNHSVTV